jgi:hypothetical protein
MQSLWARSGSRSAGLIGVAYPVARRNAKTHSGPLKSWFASASRRDGSRTAAGFAFVQSARACVQSFCKGEMIIAIDFMDLS